MVPSEHDFRRRRLRRVEVRVTEAWVAFDLDGTLVETEQIWRDARRDVVLADGGRWRPGAQETMIGMRTAEWARFMHDELTVPLPESAIVRRVVAGVARRLAEHVPILPGAERALEQLSAVFPLGLATSATTAVLDAVLAKTGWRKYFRAVVSADVVAHGKPAPDVYLKAMQLLGADPARTAAVEDSGNGIRSAHAAGCAVIAVPNREYPPGADALALAARVLDSLARLDVELVREVTAVPR
jgi:HAD superfamily hydrolase (TIGR01509 family)